MLNGKKRHRELLLDPCQLQHESSVHSTKYRSIGRETCQKKSIRRVKQKMTDIFVPTDLLAKILIRLPVKVILKFRCACKSWCNLISGEYFIDMHLELAKRSSRMILYPHTPYKPDCAVKLYSLNKESTADMVFSKSGLDTQGRPIMLLNACQGLNLLHSHTDIYVLNIWTREFARLPQGTPGLDASSSPCQFVGFGFGSTSKKYKVVRIFYHWVDRRSRTYSLGCEVYTLGVSGRWREVSPPPYPVHCQGVFSNGAIHWMVDRKIRSSRSVPHVLVSFSVEDETFSLVPLPPCTLSKELEWSSLFVSEGFLWIVQFNFRRITTDLWRLKEYHGGVWTKEHSLRIIEGNVYMVYKGKFLSIDQSYGVLCHDPKNKTFNRILSLIKGVNYYDPGRRSTRNVWQGASALDVTFHEESLVSVRDKMRLNSGFQESDRIT